MRGLDVVQEALRSFAARGEGDPINLLVGTPCFDPPIELVAAMQRAAADATFAYAPPGGTAALKKAIVRLRAHRGEVWEPSQVFVTHGAKVAVLALLGSILRPGDDVVVPTPSYGPYRDLPALFGAHVTLVPREAEHEFDVEAILGAMGRRTRAVLMASPCNPTGAVLGVSDRRRLAEAAHRCGAVVVLDLAYEDFRFDDSDERGTHDGDAVVNVHSFSKSFAVCGWRLGYVLANAALVERLTAFQAANLNPPSTIAQRALEAVTDVPESFHATAHREIRARVAALSDALSDSGLASRFPTGGFYVFADARGVMARVGASDVTSLCVDFAQRCGVAMTPGTDFAAPGWVRVSAAALRSPEDAAEVACRLHRLSA